jgi:hypothetical protein
MSKLANKSKNIAKMMKWANRQKYIRYGQQVELRRCNKETYEREKGYPVEIIEHLRNKINGRFAYFSRKVHYEFMGRRHIEALIDFEPACQEKFPVTGLSDLLSGYKGSRIPVRKYVLSQN